MSAKSKARAANAFRAMKELGISQDKVRPVLKNLLKLFDKKWEPIEAENYRALADAIFESDETSATGIGNNQEAPEPLNVVNCQNEDEVEEEAEGLARPLKRLRLKYQDGQSSSLDNSTNGETQIELVTPKEEPGELPETLPVKRNRSGALVESLANTSQSLGKRQTKQPISESGSLSHQIRLRDRGTGSVSPKIPPKEKRLVSESPSNSLQLVEPRGVPGSGLSPKSKSSAKWPIVIKDEPFTDDMTLAELPLAIVHPVPAIGEGSSGQSALDKNCNKLEVASSPSGEVKLSLSSDRPDLRMPSLDEILKYAEEKCLKSYKILDPNFSLMNIMKEVCQSVVELRSESEVNTEPAKTIDVTPAVDLLKKSSAADTLDARGLCFTSLNGAVDCQSNIEVLGPVTPATPHCDGIDDGIQANKIGGSDESGSDREGPGCIADQTDNLSLVMVQQPETVTPDIIRSIHDAVDMTKGQEKFSIVPVNEVTGSFPPSFYYIPQNAVFQNANVSFSLARVGEGDCCLGCLGDCLSTATPCACATGGEFPYNADGLLKDKFLDECISMISDLEKPCQFFCKECPLERCKSVDGVVEHCKGHPVKNFIKECWLKCGCNKNCGNRVVQRGISRNLQVFMTSDGRGWGLRALEDLPKGAFVCEYVGEVLTIAEFFLRVLQSPGEKKQSYPVVLDANWSPEGVMKDEDALCLDATCYGNIGRFINHRCFDSNLIEIPVEVETHDRHYYHVGLFTKREIKAMEELTWDYGIDFQDNEHPIKAFDCNCGSTFCRSNKTLQ